VVQLTSTCAHRYQSRSLALLQINPLCTVGVYYISCPFLLKSVTVRPNLPKKSAPAEGNSVSNEEEEINEVEKEEPVHEDEPENLWDGE
jgi:hypothetical protein